MWGSSAVSVTKTSSLQLQGLHHHHHHLEIYSAPITFAAIGAVQKSYEQQQTLTNVKSKGKIMSF